MPFLSFLSIDEVSRCRITLPLVCSLFHFSTRFFSASSRSHLTIFSTLSHSIFLFISSTSTSTLLHALRCILSASLSSRSSLGWLRSHQRTHLYVLSCHFDALFSMHCRRDISTILKLLGIRCNLAVQLLLKSLSFLWNDLVILSASSRCIVPQWTMECVPCR